MKKQLIFKYPREAVDKSNPNSKNEETRFRKIQIRLKKKPHKVNRHKANKIIDLSCENKDLLPRLNNEREILSHCRNNSMGVVKQDLILTPDRWSSSGWSWRKQGTRLNYFQNPNKFNREGLSGSFFKSMHETSLEERECSFAKDIFQSTYQMEYLERMPQSPNKRITSHEDTSMRVVGSPSKNYGKLHESLDLDMRVQPRREVVNNSNLSTRSRSTSVNRTLRGIGGSRRGGRELDLIGDDVKLRAYTKVGMLLGAPQISQDNYLRQGYKYWAGSIVPVTPKVFFRKERQQNETDWWMTKDLYNSPHNTKHMLDKMKMPNN